MKTETKSILQQVFLVAAVGTLFYTIGRHTGTAKFDLEKLRFYDENRYLKSKEKSYEVKLGVKDEIIDSLQNLIDEIRWLKTMDLEFIVDDTQVNFYIDRMSHVAQAEMAKYGIPASVKLAQGMLESRAGTHERTINNNNHFGLPLIGYYESDWRNWREHSLVIKNDFSDLFDRGTDYKRWARGLSDFGYSKGPRYSEKIVFIIEKYQLYLLDEFD